MDVAGRDPPFLVASGAYATFSNCLFRNVHLPRSEIFDVSLGGAVTLINCHFSNISTNNGIVDTTLNDYLVYGPDYRFSYNMYGDYSIDGAVYGQGDHEAYDISLAPASQDAALTYGSDYVVVDDTISDCLFLRLSEHVLPGCPEGSVAERRARIAKRWPSGGGASNGLGEGPTEADQIEANFTRQFNQQQEEKGVKRGNAFYDQYYDYNSYQDYLAPYPVFEGADYAPAPGAFASPPLPDDYVVATLGVQLSTNHPWFQAMREVCA